MSDASQSAALKAHRRLAYFLAIFLLIHFANHLTALGGIETHTQALDYARMIYQFPIIEIVLIAAFAIQIVLGITLVRQRLKSGVSGFWGKAQIASAIYLAIFIILHSAAALSTRLVIGLDTNFYWPAGTLIVEPIRWGFAIYYSLGIMALCTHICAALHFSGKTRLAKAMLILALLLIAAILPAFAGSWFPVEVPEEYLTFYRSLYGDWIG